MVIALDIIVYQNYDLDCRRVMYDEVISYFPEFQFKVLFAILKNFG